MFRGRRPFLIAIHSVVTVLALSLALGLAQQSAVDPGPRMDPSPGAGGMLPGITVKEQKFFNAGKDAFLEEQAVKETSNAEPGLGPRFNMDSCAGCHLQPAVGGTSPAVNPQVAVATKLGGTNLVPFFITPNGPVREARFVYADPPANTIPDGGVHALYTIKGRSDAPGCNIAQPDFATAAAQNNLVFRIPTPTFGLGLIEAINDSTILANIKNPATSLGITGRPNREGNAGTIARFGWKAQNKSLVIFSAEAYNVEQGVTNELFPQERDETPSCYVNATPEDRMDYEATQPQSISSDAMNFANFMRFLAPPTPVTSYASVSAASIANGAVQFANVGCAHCHTPSMNTGSYSIGAMAYKTVNLYSDLLLHHMGAGLADGVSQGVATGDEFRSAPLWGLGKRLFFLHDGRATNLVDAINAHFGTGSEANQVIDKFNLLSVQNKQDILISCDRCDIPIPSSRVRCWRGNQPCAKHGSQTLSVFASRLSRRRWRAPLILNWRLRSQTRRGWAPCRARCSRLHRFANRGTPSGEAPPGPSI
jgi:CxxC motif-containing protein (DUF1111 family)